MSLADCTTQGMSRRRAFRRIGRTSNAAWHRILPAALLAGVLSWSATLLVGQEPPAPAEAPAVTVAPGSQAGARPEAVPGEAAPAVRDVSPRAGPADLSAFRIIVDRNIFNSTRSGGRPAPARITRRPARVDTIALVGVLENGSDRIAFFDGSNPDYRCAVRPGQTVAGLTVQEIRFDKVYLAGDTQRWELPVGRALRREEDGPWELSEAVGLPLAASSGSGSGGRFDSNPDARAVSSGSSGPGGAADEILRKLMERRAREEQ